jgi:hypothetical protein
VGSDQTLPAARAQVVLVKGSAAFQEFATRKQISWTPPHDKGAPATTVSIDDPATNALVDQDRTNQIASQCGGPKAATAGAAPAVLPAFVVALAGWAVEQFVSFVVDTTDTYLQEQVKHYTRKWDSGNSPHGDDFYAIVANDSPRGFMPTKPATVCLHYSRYEQSNPKDGKSPPTLVSDFIAKVTYSPGWPEVVVIKPLRLYCKSYASLAAQPDSKEVAVKISLAADVAYLQQLQGDIKTKTIDGTLLVSTIKKDAVKPGLPIYQLYNQNIVPGITAPLPPWNFDPRVSKPQHDNMRVTLTVEEAGDVPWLLKTAASLFDKNKDNIAKQITTQGQSYVKSLIDPSSNPSSGSS